MSESATAFLHVFVWPCLAAPNSRFQSLRSLKTSDILRLCNLQAHHSETSIASLSSPIDRFRYNFPSSFRCLRFLGPAILRCGWNDRHPPKTPASTGRNPEWAFRCSSQNSACLHNTNWTAVNEPGLQIQCDSCNSDLTHSIRMKCADPICEPGDGVDICPACFCAGKEFAKHKRGHAYRVIVCREIPSFICGDLINM